MAIQRPQVAAVHDIVMAALSFILSLYLRFGASVFEKSEKFIIIGTLLFTVICGVVFSSLRLYRGLWRYASTQDLIEITKAVTLAVLIFTPLMFLINRLEGVPRSVLLINWLVLMAMLGGPRFLYKLVKDYYFGPLVVAEDRRIPVLLIGLNSNAELFLRETLRKGISEYKVVGIIDENAELKGRNVYNIRIYGGMAEMPGALEILKREGKMPRKMIVTSHDVPGEVVSELLALAERSGLSLARLPRLSEFQHNIDDPIPIRPIALEDVLGRPQHVLNRDAMRQFIEGKRVLVTGAGGTIGGELVRQIVGYAPEHITLLELSEFNLYDIDKTLEEQYPHIKRSARLADIRNKVQLERIFADDKPDIVFHAGALKHVPLTEENVTEAVLTNILGTKHVADCCAAYHVPKMVMISTDKAVHPSSVMGTTKRVAELYCQIVETDIAIVRFGNVLGSSGSVIPLFQRQIAQGGPITVTHPDIERYFMTVREAVELVIQAATLPLPHQPDTQAICVLDMGKPVRIKDLASQIIRLAGLKEDRDIKIEYTGLRPGEKMYEELFYATEHIEKTEYPGIQLALSSAFNRAVWEKQLERLIAVSAEGNIAEALNLLKALVPEYQPIAKEQ